MVSRRILIAILLCVAAVLAPNCAMAQRVKSVYDKSAHFGKYKRYAWGENYLLTMQHPNDQARINLAIVDSINRNLQGNGFVEDRNSPDFIIIFEAGGLAQADLGVQQGIFLVDPVSLNWTDLTGISSDVWLYSLAKLRITIKDAATKQNVWQAIASQKLRNTQELMSNLKETVDKFIRKTMKDFPPKK